MVNVKAIKAKIRSINNIQKITSAMEIVSTVKLQKIKQQADNFKHYMNEFLYILNIVDFSKIFQNNLSETNKELLIVVGSEKGLCGALNSKLFKKVYDETKDNKDVYDIFAIGKKTLEFFNRAGYNIVGILNLKDEFSEKDLTELKSFFIKALEDKKYSKITIAFNYFKNTMAQIPINLQVYPLLKENFEEFTKTIGLDISLAKKSSNDIIIEPSKKVFYDFVVRKFVSDMIYGSILQNKAGEHASRMIAMKNAKDNSIELKRILTITYNKQRQTVVTQEISEIVSTKVAMEN